MHGKRWKISGAEDKKGDNSMTSFLHFELSSHGQRWHVVVETAWRWDWGLGFTPWLRHIQPCDSDHICSLSGPQFPYLQNFPDGVFDKPRYSNRAILLMYMDKTKKLLKMRPRWKRRWSHQLAYFSFFLNATVFFFLLFFFLNATVRASAT